MEKKTASAIMLTLLLTSMLTLAFNIQPVKAEPAEIIIDTEVGESRFTTYPARQSPYYWVHVQDHDAFRTRAYGSNFWYTLCGADGTGEPLYYGMWQASLPSSGIYEVFVWIPNPDAFEYGGRTYTPTQSAIYQIYYSGGMTVKTVNQRLRTGGWYSLGSYTFGASASVILNDRTGEPYLSTMLAFDAIKFVGEDVNHAPYQAYNPSPYNHEAVVSVTRDLSWSGGDPDVGDTVTYDVYFGLSSSPPLVSSGQSSATYNLPTLSYSTTYYWKITSTDNHGSPTPGLLWDFSTEPPPPPPKTLTVYSSPSGVSFTANGVPHSTPWSGTYSQGTSVSLVMPDIYSAGDVRYYWDEWSDGEPSSSRMIVLNSDTTVTGTYIGPYYELTVASSPISGIPFTIGGASKTTTYSEWLYQGYYTIEMPTTHSGYVWQSWLEDGSTSRTRTVLLNTAVSLTAMYVMPSVPDFSISASDYLSIQQGSHESLIIFITSTNGFSQSVQLSVSGAPSGVTATLNPSQVTPPADGTAEVILEISVENTASPTPDPYAVLTVTGTSGTLIHSRDISLEIFGPPVMITQDDVDFSGFDQLWVSFAELTSTSDAFPLFVQGSVEGYDQKINILFMASNPRTEGYRLVRIKTPQVDDPRYLKLLVSYPCSVTECLLSAAKQFFINEVRGWIENFGQQLLFEIAERFGMPVTWLTIDATYLDCWENGLSVQLKEWTPGEDYLVYLPIGFTLTVEPVRDVSNAPCMWSTSPWYACSDLPGPVQGYWVESVESDDFVKSIYVPIEETANFWAKFYKLSSPGELRVYDSDGRITGLVEGQMREDIPHSRYYENNSVVGIFFSADSYPVQIKGIDTGIYELEIVSVINGEVSMFTATAIPTSPGAAHRYAVDWDALSLGEEGVIVQVDSDGDGVFEHTFASDSELTQSEFLAQMAFYTFSIVWGEETFIVSVESNSTVSNFAFNQPDKKISFNVTGSADTIGFCNVTIPKALLYAEPSDWTVLIDGASVSPTITENATHSCLYFTYTHSTHEVQIIGTWVIGPPPPPLSVSISPLSASILVGHSVTFTSTVTGGYTPYTYQWYLNDNPVSAATSTTWSFTPTVGGIYYVYLKATDSHGNTTQSETARIAVAPPVPVGGYSVPLQVHAKAEPVIPYIALIATLTAIFTKLRPKTKRKR